MDLGTTIRRAATELRARASATRFKPWPTDPNTSDMVFVMGSGRSGTHWLGYILDSHPDIRTTIEKPAIFNLVTRMAIDPTRRAQGIGRLVELYRTERAQTTERYYGDKSHPSLWIAEYLADAIPTARFVGIRRDPYQTVSSMLVHEGVSEWPKRWREFPLPNRFLGIDEETAPRYDAMTPAEQHALRWISHEARFDEIEMRLGRRAHVLRYHELQESTEPTLVALQQFLGLDRPFPEPEIQSESVDKWRTTLTDDDVARIHALTGVAPPV